MPNIWNGTMFGDLDRHLNASRSLSAIAEFLVRIASPFPQSPPRFRVVKTR